MNAGRPNLPGGPPEPPERAHDDAAPRPPVADPLRWSMVQEVLRALGKPVDPQELERLGRPLREEGEAVSAAREPIEIREPPPARPTRFDGRPIAEGPMTAEPREPAPPREGSVLGIFTILIALLLLALAAWIAVDFFRIG